MPKDSHLLALHSQELLRAARSGKLYKRAAPEEDDHDTGEAAEKAAKRQATAQNGIKVKRWTQVPRNAEGATISYLAKRHKNTVTLTSKAAISQAAGPTVTRATVRRIDAAGNPYEQTVTLADGQQVEGEIIATSIVPLPVAGEASALVQQVTPTRRRPPPPKRKKGPGRGRKKGVGKLPLPPTSNPIQLAEGAAGDAASTEASVGVTEVSSILQDWAQVLSNATNTLQGVKAEGEGDGQENNESEAADNSAPASDEEGDDDGDDGDEGEDGDPDEGSQNDMDDRGSPTPNRGDGVDSVGLDGEIPGEDDSRDLDMTDVSTLPQEPSVLDEDGDLSQQDSTGFSARRHFQPANPLNLAPPLPAMHLLASPRHEGSPLKNVVMLSPTEPSPNMSPIVSNFNPRPVLETEMSMEANPSEEEVMQETYEIRDAQPIADGDEAYEGGQPTVMEEPNGEELGLTASLDLPTTQEMEANLQEQGTLDLPDPAVTNGTESYAPSSHPNLQDLPEVDDSVPLEEAEETFLEGGVVPEREDDDQGAAGGDDEGSLDLLGGLEQELDRQEEFSMDKVHDEEKVVEVVQADGGRPAMDEPAVAVADEVGADESAKADG
jgi:hypothetical protein